MDAVQHTTTLHTYRKTFITSESSEKLKLALKKNIRNHQTFYNLGDKVFYKQDNLPQWKGLAKILGKNRPVLTLRHGAGYVKAHICRVQLTNHKKLKILHRKNQMKQQKNQTMLITTRRLKKLNHQVMKIMMMTMTIQHWTILQEEQLMA